MRFCVISLLKIQTLKPKLEPTLEPAFTQTLEPIRYIIVGTNGGSNVMTIDE